jgi:hypothetical protein
MSEICVFFQEIKTDVDLYCRNADYSEEVKSERIGSIVARALGIGLLAAAAAAMVTAAIIVFTAPFTGIVWIINAVVFSVLGHDMIVMGCNMSKELALLHNPSRTDQNLLQRGVNFFNNALHVGGMVGGEIQDQIPYRLHGTWVLGPVSRCCESEE